MCDGRQIVSRVWRTRISLFTIQRIVWEYTTENSSQWWKPRHNITILLKLTDCTIAKHTHVYIYYIYIGRFSEKIKYWNDYKKKRTHTLQTIKAFVRRLNKNDFTHSHVVKMRSIIYSWVKRINERKTLKFVRLFILFLHEPIPTCSDLNVSA